MPTISIDARYLRRPHVGISVYLRGLIEGVSGDRWTVTLLTNDSRHAAKLKHDFPQAHVVGLSELREFAWEQWLLPRYLSEARPQVHLAPANRGLPLISPRGTRLALIVHDLIPLLMPREYLAPDPLRAGRFLFGTAVSLFRADLVIVPSRSTAADVRRLRSRAQIAVSYPRIAVPNGSCDHPLSDWPPAFLLYCGGLDPRRNVRVLFAAYAQYRQRGGTLPLVLMGSGNEHIQRRLGPGAHQQGILFAGRLAEATKWAAYAQASAVLYPSRYEGFGLPILEALCLGTPVLAGRGGSQPEVGGDAVVYVDVDDVESVANGIEEVTSAQWRDLVKHRGKEQARRVRAATPPPSRILRGLLSPTAPR